MHVIYMAVIRLLGNLSVANVVSNQLQLYRALQTPNATIQVNPGAYVLNPFAWERQPLLLGPSQTLQVTGYQSLLDLSDISQSAVGDDSGGLLLLDNTKMLVNGSLTLFSYVACNTATDILNYLAWAHIVGNNSTITYQDITLSINPKSDLRRLRLEIQTMGATVEESINKLLVKTWMIPVFGYTSNIIHVNTTIVHHNSLIVNNQIELQNALQDNSVEHVQVAFPVNMQTWGPSIDIHRPVVLEPNVQDLLWDAANQVRLIQIGSNGSLSIINGFSFINIKPVLFNEESLLSFLYISTSNTTLGPGVIRQDSVIVYGRHASEAFNPQTFVTQFPGCSEIAPIFSSPTTKVIVIQKWQLGGTTCNDIVDINNANISTYYRITNTTAIIGGPPTKSQTTLLVAVLVPVIATLMLGITCVSVKILYCKRKRKKALPSDTVLTKLSQIATRLMGRTTVVTELLGVGSYAQVYKATWDNKVVALKVTLPLQTRDKDVEGLLGITLRHHNLVTTLRTAHRMVKAEGGARTQKNSRPVHASPLPSGDLDNTPPERLTRENWIIMEYCDLGCLKGAMHNGTFRHNWTHILYTVRDIARAIQYMHDHDTLHGDLNTNNVMLVTDKSDARGFTAKVADFGLSKATVSWEQRDFNTMSYGTVTHQPPELLTKGHLNKMADVYALGIICYELYEGETPYKGKTHGYIVNQVSLHNMRPTFSSSVPSVYRRLAEGCWCAEPEQRLTPDAVLELCNSAITQLVTNPSKTRKQSTTAATFNYA